MAQSQSLVTSVNQAISFALGATDADSDPLSFEITRSPSHGALAKNAAGYLYTPATDFEGADTVGFKASDGALSSAEALVSISVTRRETAPVANPVSVVTLRNVAATLTLSAKDPEANPVTFQIVAPPLHGLLDGVGPSLTYTPGPEFTGSDYFKYTASDGVLTGKVALVSISVFRPNSIPLAQEQVLETRTNTPVSFRLAVSDEENDPLSVAILLGPQNGRVFGAGTQFTYLPNPSFGGSDSFTYQAWDGEAYSDPASVVVKVSPAVPARLPAFASISVDGDGVVRLKVLFSPGRAVRVETSTNGQDWSEAASFAGGGDGARELQISRQPAAAAQFFRAIQE